MAPVTPMAGACPEKSSSKRQLSEDDKARRAAVERQHITRRPRITAPPVTPALNAPVTCGPQQTSRKRPLSKDDAARRAAVEMQYTPKRPRNTALLDKPKQVQLRNGSISPPVTKSIHHTEVKNGWGGPRNEKVVGTENVKHTVELQLPLMHRSHRPTIEADPKEHMPTPRPKVDHASAAVYSPSQVVKQPSSVKKAQIRDYHGEKERGRHKARDIYQIPQDPSEDEPAFEEPETSSFHYPLDEPETCSFSYSSGQLSASISEEESEPLQEQEGYVNDAESITLREAENGNISPFRLDIDDYEDIGHLEEPVVPYEAPSNDSEGEQLNDEDRMLLGEHVGENAGENGPLVLGPPSRIPKRLWDEAIRQSSQYYARTEDVPESENNFRADEADDADDVDDLDTNPPSPKERRRSGRQRSGNVAYDVLNSLVNRRKMKTRKSGSRQGTKFPEASQTSEARKRVRRLPVNELITVSERFEDSSEGSYSDIKQQHERYPAKQRSKKMRREGIGPINIAQFRFPQTPSARSLLRSLHYSSYRDGFEGREADPTGRTMPVKFASCRRATPQRMAIQLGSLKLVAEKPFPLPIIGQSQPKKKRKRRSIAKRDGRSRSSVDGDNGIRVPEHHQVNDVKHKVEQGAPAEHGYDRTLVDQEVELNNEANEQLEPQQSEVELGGEAAAHFPARPDEPRNDQLEKTTDAEEQDHGDISGCSYNSSLLPSTLREVLTPQIISADKETSDRTPSTMSPSRRRLQSKHHGGVGNNKLNKPNQSPRSSAVNGAHQIMTMARSQRSMANSSSKKTPKQMKEDMEAMFELSMVSVTRRPPDDDSDDGDNQNYSDEDRDDDESQSTELVQSSEDDKNNDTSLDMVVEQESEEEDEVRPEVYQRSVDVVHGDGMNQIKNETRLPGHLIVEDHASEMRLTLQQLAKKVLKVEGTHGEETERDIPARLQNDARSKQQQALPNYTEHYDSSWRPTAPVYSGLMMEVNEDIEDSPTPVTRRVSQRNSARLRSRFSSQALRLGHSRPINPGPSDTVEAQYDTQDSIILGETQNFVLPEREIPETQFFEDPVEPRFQVLDKPSYVTQASQALRQPSHKPQGMRTNSSPNHVLGLDREDMNLMPPSTMFRATISPAKTARLPTLTEATTTPSKSLNSLTRKASQGMGTLPASARGRTVSMPFKPPFKNMSQNI